MCFYCGQNHKEFVADDDGHDDENMEGVCCIENCARWSYFQYSFHLIDRKENFFFNRHHFFSGWHICTRTVIDLFVFSRLCLYLDLMDLNKMKIFILEPYKQARLLSMVHFTLIHSKNISFHSVLNKSPDTIVIKTRVFFHFKNDRATREEAMQRKKNMNIQQQHRTSNEKRWITFDLIFKKKTIKAVWEWNEQKNVSNQKKH